MSDYDPHYVPKPVSFNIGVKAIVVNQTGEILLLRRSDKVSRAHGWDLPGGGVDNGEHPADAIVREVQEEAGVPISSLRLFDVFYYGQKELTEWPSNVAVLCFWTTTQSTDVVLSWEHEGYQWIKPKAALNLELPPSYQAFLRTFNQLPTSYEGWKSRGGIELRTI